MIFLYKADPQRGALWADIFRQEAPELEFRIWPDLGDPADVAYLATWEPPADIGEQFPNLRILFSTGAGIDQFDLSALPATLPLVRMLEPGIEEGMCEYVTLSVLSLHRDIPQYRRQQQQSDWRPLTVTPAAQRTVGVMGLGRLGQAALAHLQRFGFDCIGWNRSPRQLDNVRCYVGQAELPAFLEQTDILVCLLPLTDETRGILNASLFAALRPGARLVHVGRGQHLDETALLQALDDGRLQDAILDVTHPEPLPAGHAFWRHPRITLTPHIASVTRPDTAARLVLQNIRRHLAGQAMEGLVDRGKGY